MFFSSKNKVKKRTLEGDSGRKKKFNIFRFLFYLLTLAFTAVTIYVIAFSPFLRIKKIYISGLDELPYEKVLQSSQAITEGKYGGLVSKNNLLLIQSGEIERKLLNQFKKIRSAAVKKVFPDTLIISVSERKALLVWCSGEDCFLADEKGSAYAPLDFNSPEAAENNLIVIRDLSQSPISLERPIIDPTVVDFIITFRKIIEDRLDIHLTQELETPKSISGDIAATTEEDWKIRLNKDLGAEKEAEMLQIVLEQNIKRGQRGELEYIDLRTEDKVYYKFKNSDSSGTSKEEKK